MKAGNTTDFFYDPDRNYYKKVESGTQGASTTVIVGAYEKETKGTVVTHRVQVGDSILIETKNNVQSTLFLIKDHLGSLVTVIDSLGAIKEQLSYDPWGKRRASTGASINLLTLQTLYTDRGYTGHLHADGVGLIHMNGRMYDPILGRFISADPLIQAPNNLQSLNRYSYVMNNPLSYTDPTGYSTREFRKLTKIVLVAGFAMATGGLAAGALAPAGAAAGLTMTQTIAMSATASAVMGGGMTLVNGGSFKDATKNAFKGAVTGAISGAMFGGIASAYATPQGSQWALGRVGWNAAAGGASSIMTGGSFKDGAKMAGLFATAAYSYDKLVKYDVTWESGGDAIEKTKFSPPNPTGNNFGFQGDGVGDPDKWFTNKTIEKGLSRTYKKVLDLREGSALSTIANKIPGINAVAGLHDVFQVGLGKVGPITREVFNVPGMLVAAPITTAALLSDPNALVPYFQHEQSKRSQRED